MYKNLVWDIFLNEISPKIDSLKNTGLKFVATAYSNLDMEGLCVVTNKGDIHILKNGDIIDNKKILS